MRKPRLIYSHHEIPSIYPEASPFPKASPGTAGTFLSPSLHGRSLSVPEIVTKYFTGLFAQ